MHCLPLFHSHGLCVGAYGTMVAGGSAVLLGGFDPHEVAETAARERATLFFGVPTMYHRLVRSGAIAGLRHLRLCVSGSAPLPAALHGEASAVLGAPVLERYGMTETLMITSNPYDGDRRPGTVGFPLPGVEVQPASRTRRTRSAGAGTERVRRLLGHHRATAAAFVDATTAAGRGSAPGISGPSRTGASSSAAARRSSSSPAATTCTRRSRGGAGRVSRCGRGRRGGDALGRVGRGGDRLGGGRRTSPRPWRSCRVRSRLAGPVQVAAPPARGRRAAPQRMGKLVHSSGVRLS